VKLMCASGIAAVLCCAVLVSSSVDGDSCPQQIILDCDASGLPDLVLSPATDQIVIRFDNDADSGYLEGLLGTLSLTPCGNGKTRDLIKNNLGVFRAGTGMSPTAIATLSASDGVAGALPSYIDGEGYRRYVDPKWVLVQFKESVPEAEALGMIAQWKCRVSRDFYTAGLYAIEIPGGMSVFDAVSEFSARRQVKYTEPYEYGLRSDFRDEYTPDMWHLHNEGQHQGYLDGHDINAFQAWSITQGSPNVIVVIIDTGIEDEHPDLDDNIIERGELDWNFSTDEGDSTTDFDGHGTATAGIVAAEWNEFGVVGVCPGCRMMPLKIHKSDSPDAYAGRADAINYAVDHKAGVNGEDFDAMVICCPWITNGRQQIIARACSTAYNAGIPMIFPAGPANGSDEVAPIYYPAFEQTTISTGAMPPCAAERKVYGDCTHVYPDWESRRDTFLERRLDVSAPGEFLWTTDLLGEDGYNPDTLCASWPDYKRCCYYAPSDSDYTSCFGGASAATGVVAGVVGLILSVTDLGSIDDSTAVEAVRTILQKTAMKVGDYTYDSEGYNNEVGYGRVDALRAVALAKYNAMVAAGGIGRDTTWPNDPWNAGISNVYVHGDVTVNENYTLTILPGTTVYFPAAYDWIPSGYYTGLGELIIKGSMVADGGGGEEISFISADVNPEVEDWGGITVEEQGRVKLVNCEIRDCKHGVSLYTREQRCDSACVIDDCEFGNIETCHIRAEGFAQSEPPIFDPAWAHITNCTFDVDSPYCLYCVAPAESVIVEGCSIVGSNYATFGVYVDSPQWIGQGNQGGPRLIDTNIGHFMTGTGVYVPRRTEVTMSGGELVSNKWGVVCEDEGSISIDGDDEETLVGLCTTGIETRDESTVTVTGGSTVGNCTRGLYVKDMSSAYVRDTVFIGCYLYAVESTYLTVCNLGEEPDGGGNSFISSEDCIPYQHVKAKPPRLFSLVMAEGNWWGSDPPDADCVTSITVDYNPWLTSDPNEVLDQWPVAAVLEGISAGVSQNYPNPFNGATSISYSVPESGTRALIEVFDARGRLVKKLVDGPHGLGRYVARWDGLDSHGRTVASGVYFFRIEIGDNFSESKKMILWR
jgi:subtilisin family serine protease